MPRSSRLALWGVLLLVAGLLGLAYQWRAGMAPQGGTLWIAEPLSDRLALVDLASGQVVQRIEVGRLPHQLSLGPKGQVYVLESGSQSVSIIDPLRRKTVRQRIVGELPDHLSHRALGEGQIRAATSCKTCHAQSIAGSLPGSMAFGHSPAALWVTELRARRISRLQPEALQTEGQLALLGDDSSPTQVLVQPKTGHLVVVAKSYRGDIPGQGGIGDTGLRISMDPEHAGSLGGSRLTVFDSRLEGVLGRLELPMAGAFAGVFSSDGNELYLACRGADEIAVLSPVPPRLLRRLPVAPGPAALAWIDSRTLAVACLNTAPGRVLLLDAQSGRLIRAVEVPANPASLVYDARSQRLYVGCSGASSVAEVDLQQGRVLREFKLESHPAGLLLLP